MIFVTVGTHEQGFDRLIKAVDDLVQKNVIREKVIGQIGYTQYIPQNFEWHRFLSYDEMNLYESKADVVITHGGPSTFMSVLAKQKIPVVVPRLAEFNEHVNDHQLIFANQVLKRGYPIIVVKDIQNLQYAIQRAKAHVIVKTHNQIFVSKFTQYVEELFRLEVKR